jgi:hypothetical protein
LLPIVTSLGKPIVNESPLTTTSTSFAVPDTVKVSPPSIEEVFEPSLIVQLVEILAVLTAVTKPLALTVSTGIAVELPCDPTSLLTVAKVVEIVAVSPAS